MPRYSYRTRVRSRAIRGRGGFFSDAWDKISGAANAIGRPLARSLGSAAGLGLGRAALSLAGLGGYRGRYSNPSMVRGYGAYRSKRRTVRAPQSYRSSARPPRSMIDEGQSPASVRNSANKYFIISHKEYLGDISTVGSAFNIASYPINPGMLQTFPWLCTIAQNFISWKPRGMLFEFKSTSADALNSTNTALGEVLMATQYNVGSPAFTNQANMLNYDKCVAAKPAVSFYAPVECATRALAYKKYFIRHGSIPTGEDYRLYDIGTFYVATYGQQAAAVIGQLWCTYEMELLEPTMVGGAGETVLSDYWSSTTGITTSKYFGSSVIPSSGNSLGVTLAGTTITFPTYVVQGRYLLTYCVIGTSTAVTQPTITATSGCSLATSPTISDSAPGNTETATRIVAQRIVNITAGGAVLTFSAATLPASATSMKLIITQFDSDNVCDALGTAVSI